MFRNFARCFALLGVLVLLFACTGGCVRQTDTAQEAGLRVFMDTGGSSISPDRIKWLVNAFSEAHDGVEVVIEELPVRQAEHEAYLERIRTQIMAGHGPDVFLIGPESTLFPDMNQSIRSGIFLDLSAYYDGDSTLPKERLSAAIMGAGVVDGARYALPFYFNIPVLYLNIPALESVGIQPDSLGNGLSGLMEVVRAAGPDAVAFPPDFPTHLMSCLFPPLIDYGTGTMTCRESSWVDFLTAFPSLAPNHIWLLPDRTPFYPTEPYLSIGESFWLNPGSCVYAGSLVDLVETLRIAKAVGVELAVRPLTAQDGSLCADVTLCGAVGAGCRNPALAYEFLRQFLLEENQWHFLCSYTGQVLYNNFAAWPVLTGESGPALDALAWNYSFSARPMWMEDQKDLEQAYDARKSALESAEPEESDFAILDSKISTVYLPSCWLNLYIRDLLLQLNPYRNPDAADVDIDALAAEAIQFIQFHAAEG